MYELYSDDINMNALKGELMNFSSIVRLFNQKTINSPYQYDKSIVNMKDVKIVVTSCMIDMKIHYPNILKLIQIYFTPSMTSAEAERTFSSMKRVKTYLRSTMCQSRLNSIMIMHHHKNLVSKIDQKSIAHAFISANVQRSKVFGSFRLKVYKQ